MIDFMKNSNIQESGLDESLFYLHIHNQQKIMNLVILLLLLTDLNEFSLPILFSIFRNCALITTLRITCNVLFVFPEGDKWIIYFHMDQTEI